MPITEYLEKNSRLYGDESALVEISPEEPNSKSLGSAELFQRRQYSWREFNDQANLFANALLSRGFCKEKKIAILLTNCLEWLPVYFGVLKTGALAVPINYRFSAAEIKYCLELSDADMVVFGAEFIGRMEKIAGELEGKCAMLYLGGGECPDFSGDYSSFVEQASGENPGIALTDADHAAIYFSSGTTGFPKAILHDHESLMHAAIAEQKHHFQTHEDVFLCIPPLYHTGAKMHWFGSLLVGGRTVLLRGVRADWILKIASQERCSIVWLLVPWAQDIVTALDRGELRLEDYDLSHWRLMHIGAQPVPKSLIDSWLRLFPSHQYDTNYGLSEAAGPGPVHLGIGNTHKVGAIGKAGYGWETRIVDEQLNDVPQGQIGELCLKGAGNMLCYYRDKDATAATLKDGWLLTGDMVKADEDGFIYLVDRKKDVIITGGENIYPVQIENFLSAHPSVHDVAVIGLPDERLGEIAAAIVQLKKGAECSREEIAEFCRALPRYKRPRQIVFAEVIRNATGKIDKPLLRSMYR